MTPRQEAQALLKKLMVHYPPEIQAKLAPLLPKNRKRRPPIEEVISRLERENIEDLDGVSLAVLCRACCHLIGEQSSWIVSAERQTLIAMLLRSDYQDALLEVLQSRQ